MKSNFTQPMMLVWLKILSNSLFKIKSYINKAYTLLTRKDLLYQTIFLSQQKIITLIICSGLATLGYSQSQFQLNGQASTYTGQDCYILTTATNYQFGSMWFRKKADLSKDFDITANLYFGTNDASGADGITFTFQNQCTSAGANGSGLGVGGVTPSLIVEFDTYQNGFDPSADHIGIQKNGDPDHTTADKLIDPVPALANSGNIEDGQYHTVRIKWAASNTTLVISFDGTDRLTYTGDIVKNIFSSNPYVYWGFSAATGAFNNEQRACIQSFPNNIVKLSDATICEGDTIQPVLPGGTSYSWSPNYKISNVSIYNPKLYPDITTKYYVSITDACNNTQKDSMTVTVNPKPTVTLNSFSPVCNGTPAFTITGGSPSGGTFSGAGVSGGKFTASVAGVGKHNITYTYTNNNQCTSTDTKELEVLDVTQATLTSFSSACINDAAFNLTNGSPVGGSYSGNGVSGGAFNPAIAGVGTHTITYTYTSSNGCISSASQSITVNNKPSFVITSSNGSVICSGASVILNAPASSTTKYQWFLNGTSETSLSNANTQFSTNIAGDYTLTALDQNGCKDTSPSFTITTGTKPMATINASSTTYCPGDSINLTTAIKTGETIAWYLNNSIIPSANDTSYKTPIQGTYAVQITSSDGCSAKSSSVTITQLQGPAATISMDKLAFCPGTNSITLTASSETNASYTWYNNSVIINGETLQSYTATGTGVYKVKVTLPNGCSKISNDVNLVNANNPSVILSSSSNSFCEGSSFQLTATSIPGAIYKWYNGNTNIAGPLNANFYNITSGGSFTVEATSDLGCTGKSNSIDIIENTLPVASISTPQTSICSGNSIVITASQVPDATYEWFKDNVSLGSPTSNQYTLNVSTAGTYEVKVDNGCSATSSGLAITVNNIPGNAGTISGEVSFCAGDNGVTYSINKVAGATDYMWEVNPVVEATIKSGQGTSAITLDFLNQNVTLKVTPRNSCGTGISSSLAISVDNSLNCYGNLSFGAYPTNGCIGSVIKFYDYSNQSQFGLTTYWDFGSGATPATATGIGPHTVTYSSLGAKDISVTYKDAWGNEMDNLTRTSYINISGSATTSSISGNNSITDCSSEETYSVNPTLGSQYSWSASNGTSILSGNGTNSIVVKFANTGATISVIETTTAGCQSMPVSIDVTCSPTTAISIASTDFTKIYPNPTKGVLAIDAILNGNENYTMIVYDLMGEEVFRESGIVSGSELYKVIDISHLTKGMYLLRIIAGDKTISKNIVLE